KLARFLGASWIKFDAVQVRFADPPANQFTQPPNLAETDLNALVCRPRKNVQAMQHCRRIAIAAFKHEPRGRLPGRVEIRINLTRATMVFKLNALALGYDKLGLAYCIHT